MAGFMNKEIKCWFSPTFYVSNRAVTDLFVAVKVDI